MNTVILFIGEDTEPVAVLPGEASEDAIASAVRADIEKWCCPPEGEVTLDFEHFTVEQGEDRENCVAVVNVLEDGFESDREGYAVYVL